MTEALLPCVHYTRPLLRAQHAVPVRALHAVPPCVRSTLIRGAASNADLPHCTEHQSAALHVMLLRDDVCDTDLLCCAWR